ncbi:proteasome subunit beta [Halosimplex amylolyticum]|uniref:proteasome subunit beta n=1 Tax=Halosimplex amylolyticum TaxID=3396616 RepID=UPI003F57D1A7
MTPPDFGPASGALHELTDDYGEADRTADVDAPTFDTGTTIVAVAADDGVVMAADQRMSLGGRFTANKNVRKLSRVHPRAALAISGSVGPAQDAIRSIRAEASLYQSRRGEPMTMQALSRTAGHVLRGLPVAPILGGVDDTGGHVYELDGGGSVMEDAYAAGGSGMQVAYGVLEGRFDPDATRSEATETAVAAVEAASARDTASGNGVTVARISVDGVEIEALDGAAESGGERGETDDAGEVA